MGKNRLVVKDNSLIDASFNLSLIEQRLMLLAIVEARELKNLSNETLVVITADAYGEQYKVSKGELYNQLAEGAKKLFDRQFSFIEIDESGFERVSTSRWVNQVTYVKKLGKVELTLNKNVVTMITRLEQQFTRYYINQVSEFKSQHSIRVYELISKWRSNSKTQKYEISDLRGKLGIEDDQYEKLSNFKARVIDTAINEINEKSDLIVSYEQFKEGRTVKYFEFYVKEKEKSQSQSEVVLTPRQIGMFGDRLSRLDKFQNHFPAEIGMSQDDYTEIVCKKLEDSFYVKSWMQYLLEVGFSPK